MLGVNKRSRHRISSFEKMYKIVGKAAPDSVSFYDFFLLGWSEYTFSKIHDNFVAPVAVDTFVPSLSLTQVAQLQL
jgi:hypothetical protein